MSWLSDLFDFLRTGRRVRPPVVLPSPPGPPIAISSADPTAIEAELLRLHNAERAAVGRSPLSIDARLSGAARYMADYQAATGRMTHEGPPQAPGPGDRVRQSGYAFSWAGENAGEQPALPPGWFGPDPRTPGWIMKGWMDDPPHRANVLDPRAVHFGAALAIAPDGSRYFTCVFARPLA